MNKSQKTLLACKLYCYCENNFLLTNKHFRFWWASLQLQSLCSLQTDEAIRERLGRLPPKLEELYLELYERLTATTANTDRDIAIGAFTLLLSTQSTLNSGEFLAALSTTLRRKLSRLTIEQVVQLCSNMIIYDPTLDIFRFSHSSVKEFWRNARSIQEDFYPSKDTSCQVRLKRFQLSLHKASSRLFWMTQPRIILQHLALTLKNVPRVTSDLFDKVQFKDFNRQTIDSILEDLPDLLKAFALKVGHNTDNPKHRDVMYFCA